MNTVFTYAYFDEKDYIDVDFYNAWDSPYSAKHIGFACYYEDEKHPSVFAILKKEKTGEILCVETKYVYKKGIISH